MTIVDDSIIALSEGVDLDSNIIATYLLQGPSGEDMLSRAEAIATEQTVGRSIYQVGGMEWLIKERGGKLIGLTPIPDHECRATRTEGEWQRYIARVAFPVANINYQIPMLLTTVMGDVSMSGVMKLVDLDLPPHFIKDFQGPKFGIEGIRKILGVSRPLICSIIKPSVGLSSKQASEIFYSHAMGGTDIIKDDELMSYGGELKLEDRVRACVEAQKRAYEETGDKTIYLVSITDRPDQVVEKAKRAIEAGANGLMITPLSTGIATIQMLSENPDIQVPIFGHPAMLGATSWSPDFGIGEHILIGKLFRLAGVDINAIPVPYGRFTHLQEKFIRLYTISKAPMGHIKPVFTMAGGGLNPINAANVMTDLGNDVILVAGGSIQVHPMGLSAGIRAIRQSIQAYIDKVPLAEAAKQHEELNLAWELWGPKSSKEARILK